MKFLLALLLLVLPAHAATYYVSKTGNDTSGTGAVGAPWLTIQRALNTAVAGDSILVGAGVYDEEALTQRDGTSDNRITIDGQNVATLRMMRINKKYTTFKNFTLKGVVNMDSGQLRMERGGHFTRIENVIIDTNNQQRVSGIYYITPSYNPAQPFGTETNAALDPASNCYFTGMLIKNIRQSSGINIGGSNNLIENSVVRDIDTSDMVRFFGRNNRINRCQFYNGVHNYSGNHPDFIQAFGVDTAAADFILENCYAQDVAGGLTQFEGNLNPNNGNYTLRNNVFVRCGTGSNSVQGVKYYNNVLFRCGMPGWGTRYHWGWGNVYKAAPEYAELRANLDVPSGSLVPGETYMTYKRTGTPGTAYITYNGQQVGPGGTGQFKAVEGVTTYTETHPTFTAIALGKPNIANLGECIGNVFLECGLATSDTSGWYNFGANDDPSDQLNYLDCVADYNYVAGPGFAQKRRDELMRPIGNPGGWNFQRWYEPNGINGGDPKFVDFSTYDFRLLTGSPLIDQGDPSIAVLNDFIGTIRPLGAAPDIGAYEYDDGSPPPDPPTPGTPPAAPSALTATASSSTAIALTWTDNADNEGSFQVDRSLNGSTWTQIATLGENAVSYASTGLTPSTLYYYRVRASNGDGDSAYTSTASATTQAPPVVNNPPAAPSGLAVVAIGSSGATLTWVDNADNEDNFEVARSLDEAAWVTVSTPIANAQEYTNGGLSPAITYYYRVRAVNIYGFSAWSASSATTTAATPPRAPRSPRPAAIGVGTP